MRNVLIVKLGYCETLTSDVSNVCSLGDVFRSTSVLHLFKGDRVTWVTDRAAVPLLAGNPMISRIVRWDEQDRDRVLDEPFDVVVNLENVPEVSTEVRRVTCLKRYGFVGPTDGAVAAEQGSEVLRLAFADVEKRRNTRCWDDLIYEMLGHRWTGQSYILGYRPHGSPTHDIGFNIHVGPKFPTKAWPRERWNALEELLRGRYTVSYQKHPNDLHRYIDWINSVRILVTNDSLAVYLGIALGKRVVTLISPTSDTEIAPHPALFIVKPTISRDCIPCGGRECRHGDPCIGYITPDEVHKAIESCSESWIASVS